MDSWTKWVDQIYVTRVKFPLLEQASNSTPKWVVGYLHNLYDNLATVGAFSLPGQSCSTHCSLFGNACDVFPHLEVRVATSSTIALAHKEEGNVPVGLRHFPAVCITMLLCYACKSNGSSNFGISCQHTQTHSSNPSAIFISFISF